MQINFKKHLLYHFWHSSYIDLALLITLKKAFQAFQSVTTDMWRVYDFLKVKWLANYLHWRQIIHPYFTRLLLNPWWTTQKQMLECQSYLNCKIKQFSNLVILTIWSPHSPLVTSMCLYFDLDWMIYPASYSTDYDNARQQQTGTYQKIGSKVKKTCNFETWDHDYTRNAFIEENC